MKVEAFLPYLDKIQQLLIAEATEVNAGGTCSSCGVKGSAKYRCRECFNTSAVCSKCIIKRHQLQPFHQIERWTGTHFDAHTLHDLGLVINFGHDGARCPASFQPKSLVVVHTNGIHHCSFQFCNCSEHTENFQHLLLLRLFPATLKFPVTVFTFALLETFHQLTRSSKITPYDYFDTLQKLTNAVFPQDIAVCIH